MMAGSPRKCETELSRDCKLQPTGYGETSGRRALVILEALRYLDDCFPFTS